MANGEGLDFKLHDHAGCVGGFRLVIVPPTKCVVNRSWKERLFSRPWRPFQKTNDVYHEMIADGQVVHQGNTLFMNQTTANKIQATFNEKGRFYYGND